MTAADLQTGRTRLPPRSIIADAVEVLREWRNDGADGESAHLVCDALVFAWRELDALAALVPDDAQRNTLVERTEALAARVVELERERDRAIAALKRVYSSLDGILDHFTSEG